jgi:dihydropteroate synthase
MGVVNVTPDSFSDGGRWLDPGDAIAHGLELLAQGADIIDVGGESTRPGAGRVPADEELRRIGPVVAALAETGACVSIDTTRTSVARPALRAGAALVNDVSGGLADPAMARLVADAGIPYVLMHSRGPSRDMRDRAVYQDVVREVTDELRQRVDAVTADGVDPANIILDPGIGFAKHSEHNWSLLARLPEIGSLGGAGQPFRVLVGASRKSFIARLLAGPDGAPRPYPACDDATVAISALAALVGAWCVRVHAVAGNADAVRVAARLGQEAGWPPGGRACPGEAGRPEPDPGAPSRPDPDPGAPGRPEPDSREPGPCEYNLTERAPGGPE